MGKSHISMIEDAFKEVGSRLTLNQIHTFVNKNWQRTPDKNKIRSLLAKRPQFISVETTKVLSQTGQTFDANLWEMI